jgi:oxygen-independent coproporphyrinogen-3 oxidase
MAYWEGVYYLGLGLGSASLIENTRFSNTNSLTEYQNQIDCYHKDIMSPNLLTKATNHLLDDLIGIRRNIDSLSKNQQIEEFMFLGLRTSAGVSKNNFFNKFGIAMDDLYDDLLLKLEREGLITINNDTIVLTDFGIDVSNRVLSEFLFD